MRTFLLRSTTVLAALAGLAASPATLIAREASAPGAVVSHERLLPLQGGRNFRDLGGYPAAGGRHVKWGLLFRSGSMHGLTAADYAYLEKRGIKVVCDFRSTDERTSEPAVWPQAGAPQVLSDDYKLDMASFMPAGPPSGWTAESARAAMTASYPRMLGQFHDQYLRMFAELLAGHAPLAFNCSAGKDRTGVAAALLLTALGVPRASVIEDYLLTNRYLDSRKLLAANANTGQATALSRLPVGVQQAMMAADRRYIEAALAVVDSHPGGVRGWFRDEMGLSVADIDTLRRRYLD